MLEDINNGTIRLLIVRDMTRICRGLYQMNDFMDTLKKADVDIQILDKSHKIPKNEIQLIKAIEKYMNQRHSR